jgi:hypothetical protein
MTFSVWYEVIRTTVRCISYFVRIEVLRCTVVQVPELRSMVVAH